MGLLCFGTVTSAGLSLLSVVALISNWLANDAIRKYWPDYRKIPCLHDATLILPAVVGFVTLVGSCWTRWRNKDKFLLVARCSEGLAAIATICFIAMNLGQNPGFRQIFVYPRWNDPPESIYQVVNDSSSKRFASSGTAVWNWQTSTAIAHATQLTMYGFFMCVFLHSFGRFIEPDQRIPGPFVDGSSRQPVAPRRSPLIISITILICAIIINYLNIFMQLIQPNHLNPWIDNVLNNEFVNAQFGLRLNLLVVPISIIAIATAASSSFHRKELTMILLSLASLSASIAACVEFVRVFQCSREGAVVTRTKRICDGQIDVISMDMSVFSQCKLSFLSSTSYFPPAVFLDEVWCRDLKPTSSWIHGFCLGLNGVMVMASLALLYLSWSLNYIKDLVVGVMVKVYNILLEALIDLPSFLVQFAERRRWSNIDQDIKTNAKSTKCFKLFVGTSLVLLSVTLFTSECLAVMDNQKVASKFEVESRNIVLASYYALALSASSLIMGGLTLFTICKPSAKLFTFHLLLSSVGFACFLVWNKSYYVEGRYRLMLRTHMRNKPAVLLFDPNGEDRALMYFSWKRVVELVISGLSAVLIPVLIGCTMLFEAASLMKLWMPKLKEKEDGRSCSVLGKVLAFMLFTSTSLAYCLAMVVRSIDAHCYDRPTGLYNGWEVLLSSAVTLSIFVLFFSWKKNKTGKFFLAILAACCLVFSRWVWYARSRSFTRSTMMTMPAMQTCNGNLLLMVLWVITIFVSLSFLMMTVREILKSMWDACNSYAANGGGGGTIDPSGDVAQTPLLNLKMNRM